jgi:heptosyltransferase-1
MRILLIRTSALGDVVHCLPVLSALRSALPEARIAWVVEDLFAPLLEGHPDLDEVIPVRLRAWRKCALAGDTRRELFRFVRRLRGFRADVAVDLMGNHKAGSIARLSGAARRIGASKDDRRERSSALWIDEPVPVRGVHAVDRALATVAPLLPRAGELPAADFGGDKILPGTGMGSSAEDGDDEPFVLVHPGAGWGNKVYPPERWGAVARGLAERSGGGTRVALSPSKPEREMAEVIVASAGGAALPVEAAGLDTLVCLSRRARLVLGGDSGPIHLAHALGTPVLSVMGPTDPARHGPYGVPASALAHPLPCSYCYRRFEGTKACLLEIPAAAVLERSIDILVSSGFA